VEANLEFFVLFCFISILPLEIQISEWDDWFTPPHFCLV